MFTPGDGSEDAVTCPLCHYSVEGWEQEDDPLYVGFPTHIPI